jgi:hypothetical protein
MRIAALLSTVVVTVWSTTMVALITVMCTRAGWVGLALVALILFVAKRA